MLSYKKNLLKMILKLMQHVFLLNKYFYSPNFFVKKNDFFSFSLFYKAPIIQQLPNVDGKS